MPSVSAPSFAGEAWDAAKDIWNHLPSVFSPTHAAEVAGAPHSPSGPHGVVSPGGPSGIVPPNMTINNQVSATLAGKAEAVFGGVTVELGGLGAAIDGRIKAAIGSIGGMFKTGSGNSGLAMHDGSAAPQAPGMGGVGTSR
jgi:hypothetical protein